MYRIVQAVYNCTVAFDSKGLIPSFMNIANGRPMMAHFHLERIPLDDVPVESDEICASFLRDLFKKKDDLFETFLQTGQFPGPKHHIPRRLNDLLMWAFWAVVLCVPLFWYIISVLLSGSYTQQLVLACIFFLGLLVARVMIKLTEIDQESDYATQTSKNGLKKSQ
ncbi:1-acyl-sn-glycerol-3-phosphate acyltransferase delta [Plakobranchus ocellatus]|uniref:1-acyl-sn-glycerol-3-phosphate acyltransferase delta n=1 Tax=Plakobranchus ocellatus TaxID=259542 RepID=A0AAV4CNF8_9GAST|nr:1-acyl-sn-glycerol-3-phosphate acyltransferase delta [Plakobranchus ocellatus]